MPQDFIANAAQIYGAMPTILTLSAVLVIVALIFGYRLRRGVNRLVQALTDAQQLLQDTRPEPRDFVSSYEEISEKFAADPVIGEAWAEWRTTLIMPSSDMAPVRASVRPGDYISTELLRHPKIGINPRLHAAFPNYLVGVGLLLTFIGLSLALGAAGGIVGGDKVQRDLGLRNLLDASSAKFIFSLVGLLCSISYGVARGQFMLKVDQALDAFLVTLERRIPLATAATLQAEANELLLKSYNAQTVFNNELAVNMGQSLSAALDTRLGEHIGPLREAIERLSQGLSTKGEDTMRQMLETFLDGLRGGTDDQMHKVAETLQALGTSMTQIQSGMAEAADRMSRAADQMAAQIERQTGVAMDRISLQMEGLVANLRDLADQSRDAGNDAMARAAEQIAAAGASFTQSAQDVAAALGQATASMAGKISGEAEAASRLLASEMVQATTALRLLSEQSRDTGHAALSALTERLGTAAAALEQTAANISGALSGGAGEAAAQMTAAMETMKAQFERLSDGIGQMVRDAGGEVANSSAAGAEALRLAVIAAGDHLRAAGAEAGRSLEAGGRVLAEPTRDMQQSLVRLQAEAAALGQAVGGMREAAIGATEPMRRAAGDLVNASAQSRATSTELATAVQQIAPLAEAFGGISARFAEMERRLAELAGTVTGAAARFDGMDTALAKVFDRLRTGLDEFTKQVNTFVQATNTDMAKAMTALHGAIGTLAETLEDIDLSRLGGKKG